MAYKNLYEQFSHKATPEKLKKVMEILGGTYDESPVGESGTWIVVQLPNQMTRYEFSHEKVSNYMSIHGGYSDLTGRRSFNRPSVRKIMKKTLDIN